MARLGEATKMVLPPMDLQPEDKVRAALGLEEPPRVIRAMLNCRERQLLDYQTRVIALERALRDARINVQYAYLPENCGDHCRNNCRDCVLKNTLDDIDAALNGDSK